MILLHLLRFGSDEEKMGEGRRGGGRRGGKEPRYKYIIYMLNGVTLLYFFSALEIVMISCLLFLPLEV